MPIYVARCPSCQKQVDYFRPLSKYKETPTCECGSVMTKVITPVFIPQEYQSFISPIDGKWVHGKEQYEAHNRQHNVVPASDYDGHKPSNAKPSDLKGDIAKAINQLGDL